MLQKNEEKNCPFVGAPVRPNMLNMPKSASASVNGPVVYARSELSDLVRCSVCSQSVRSRSM